VLEFWKEVFTDKGVLGSIIGGLVGGFFTYLAVILTFKYQRKFEYPEKLVTLTEMIFMLEDFKPELDVYVVKLQVFEESQRLPEILDLEKLNRTIITMAANVDKKTYRLLVRSRENWLSDEALIFFDRDALISSMSNQEILNRVQSVPVYIDSVMAILKHRISYYEKKI